MSSVKVSTYHTQELYNNIFTIILTIIVNVFSVAVSFAITKLVYFFTCQIWHILSPVYTILTVILSCS